MRLALNFEFFVAKFQIYVYFFFTRAPTFLTKEPYVNKECLCVWLEHQMQFYFNNLSSFLNQQPKNSTLQDSD